MSSLHEAVKSSGSRPLEHVLILHEVADYPVWKRVFDAAAVIRKAAGEHSYQVLRERDDANRIVHLSAWSSHDDAMRFFQSPELEEIRRHAGVKAPTFLYLHKVEQGLL